MATAEKLTLSERMALARERTAEARATAPAPLSRPQGTLPRPGVAANAALAAATATRPAPLGEPGSGSQAKNNASPHGGHGGTSWQLPGKAGDLLMLLPGQMHFGAQVAGLRTLLGSCVAVTIWHPQRKLGGMCHFLLPSRPRKAGEALDGRYGDEALEAMVAQLQKAGTQPSEYQAHLCGGADTMPEGSALKFNVGERNIEQGFSLVDRYGFEIQGVDVGEDVPRTVTLALATGAVDMRRGKGRAPTLNMAAAAPARR